MKCIIHCPAGSTGWIQTFFPDYPPYLLKFGNKPYLEFLIDFCILSGIKEIRLVTDIPVPEVYRHFGRGQQFGVKLSYASMPPSSHFKKIIQKNMAFIDGDDLLILSGMIWLNYDKQKVKPLQIDRSELHGHMQTLRDGWLLIGKDHIETFPDEFKPEFGETRMFDVFCVDSIQSFYQQNMRLVYEQTAQYNLPGYGDSQSFVIGRDVAIPPTAEVITPIIIGNSVQLGKNTKIGSGVIIGDNSLIDNNATLHNTVIMGNSYIGCNLELDSKICYRNYLIDPDKQIKIDIIDEFLLTPIVKAGYWKCSLMQSLSALLMMVLYFVPFIILRPFARLKAEETDCFMTQQQQRRLKLHLFLCPPRTFFGRCFMRLSLDCYHLLPLAVAGHLRLVGSYILPVNEENRRTLKQFPDYAPGIFSYSAYLNHDKDPFQREMDELYYIYHASFGMNLKILKGILFRNLLTHHETMPEEEL